jgi:SNF family Na+-dependent transporter
LIVALECTFGAFVKLTLLIALLVGTQIGLSDGLILPTLLAEHGSGSFLLLYAFFKMLFILPILQAELVAGRLYRMTPFEFSFLVLNKTWARISFTILLMAVIFVIATNLFNTAWALIFGIDGLQGELLSLRPLDQNLYWFEQSQNTNRIMSIVIAQGILLMLMGGLAWNGIASIFVAIVPLIGLFILYCLPKFIPLFLSFEWPALSWVNVLAAMQHALSSSMVGLLVWYVLGTKISDRLPTARVIISVQLFDVLFGIALLSISWEWLGTFSGNQLDAGSVLRSLVGSLEGNLTLPFDVGLWLFILCVVGLVSSLPMLLLVAQETSVTLRQWLLAVTVLLVVLLSGVLVLSHGVYSPLTWYGKPLYEVVQHVSQGVIVPFITAGIAIWVGWVVWPNRVLMQINPHGGIRYFLWRVVLRFVVPIVLGLVFARAAMALVAVSLTQALFWCLGLLLISRLISWVRKRAIFPGL